MRLPFTGRSHASAQASLSTERTGREIKSTPLVAVELSRQAAFTSPDFASLCREGFARNPVVYRCVRLIAEAAASIPLKGDELPAGHIEALERFYGYLQVSGTAYLKATVLDGEPVGVHAVRPDTVTALTNARGRIIGYKIQTDRAETTYRSDPLTGQCDIFALALFNPMEEASGQSPLRAAATSIDLHNQGTRWAKSLLDNSARPSGALVYNGAGGLSQGQLATLKAELEHGFTGPSRAGRPMVLEGGLDWKTMGLSPADMDFTQARREASRDIALAFGVPPMLLGIPGDNTYSNYAEANRAFWRQTIIPLVTRTARAVSAWLSTYGDPVRVLPDLDAVPALATERAALWSRLEAASFLEEDERRVLAGLEPKEARQ